MELTVDRLAFLVDNWDKMTSKQIGEQLGVKEGTVSYWGTRYREMGGDLPRKARIRNTQLEETIAKLIAARGGQPIDPKTKQPYEFQS